MPYAIREMHDVERFIYEKSYSASTARSYRYYVHRFDQYLAGQGLELNDAIQPDHLRQFIESQKWAANTNNIAYAALVGYLKWKFGAAHPALQWKPRRGSPVRLLRYLGAEELRSILSWLRDQGTEPTIRDEAMIALMADTGLRVSEICRLQMATIDFAKRKLVVTIKGGGTGEAVYSANTASRLEAWLRVRARVIRRTEASAETRGRPFRRPVEVFISTGGKKPASKMTRNGIKKNFLLIGQRSGFGKLAPHDLRRTFAMLAIRNGAPTRVVQAAGRWASLDMVERYSQFIEPEDLAAYFPMKDID